MAEYPVPEGGFAVTRKDAIARGHKVYLTGEPCAHGHKSFRSAASGVCNECNRIKSRKRIADGKVDVEKARADSRDRYQNDPEFRERIKARSRKWHSENKERASANKKANYEANKEDILEKSRIRWANYRKDPEFVARERARKVKEMREFPERRKRSYADRRSKEKSAEGKYNERDIADILERQNWKCVYCPTELRDYYEIDHIMPLKLGGSHWPSNLQCLCRPCNRRKSSKHPDVFAKEIGRL